MKAGLTLDRSLSVLSNLTENPYLSEVVRELLSEIKGGKSLSDALHIYPQVFPESTLIWSKRERLEVLWTRF